MFSCVMCACIMCVCVMCAGCHGEPGPETATRSRSPQYRGVAEYEASSGERGNMMITEINFAGSVRNTGEYDPEDVFIELQNRHPRPINISGWHLILEGDIVRTLVVPEMEEPIEPNDFFVIAAKDDGAFQDSADLFMPRLVFGKQYVKVDIRDADLRLIEGAGHDGKRVFAGGYDTVSVRSMERVQLIFGNRGNASRNWHAYSANVGFASVHPGWQNLTFASPGAANSQDYSGSSAAGGFE